MAIQNILVVDDSATDSFYLSEILKGAGFTVANADSGEACLEYLTREKPDLILMDVLMPGINGFQTTRAITKNPDTAHIPVIVCTGKAQLTDRVWALRQGAKDCLAKPVPADELLAKIRALEAVDG
jgi:twitching motility two-component system response regulator PilH